MDDGSAAVDSTQDFFVVVAETSAFKDLHHLIVEGMLPSTLSSKLAVTLEKVLTHVEVDARVWELAVTVATVAPVVVRTYL